tara:strand:- start:3036 stop:3935 length:900 start_codon:yes stop_codon:yes gene_type:complete
MFYEYAIDPDIFKDEMSRRTFLEAFSVNTQRLISDTPKNWSRHVLQQITAIPHEICGPQKKKALKERLAKIVKQNLIRNRSIKENKPAWFQLVANEHQRYPFAAVYTPTPIREPVKSYSFNELDIESPPTWYTQAQAHVKREARHLVHAALPLLSISKEIHLIDRMLKFTEPTWGRYAELITELLAIMGTLNYQRGISTLNIHTSDNYGDISATAEIKLLPLLPDCIKVNIYQWPHGKMHDRFFLTDIGAINIGHGLDNHTDNNAEKALVVALDHTTFKEERAKISGTPVDKIKISKNK